MVALAAAAAVAVLEGLMVLARGAATGTRMALAVVGRTAAAPELVPVRPLLVQEEMAQTVSAEELVAQALGVIVRGVTARTAAVAAAGPTTQGRVTQPEEAVMAARTSSGIRAATARPQGRAAGAAAVVQGGS